MSTNKGSQTQDRILQKALQLFVARGYHGTSMREIAAESELAAASLYNHFASKERLFEAVLHRYHPYREVIAAIVEAEGDSVEELVQSAAQSALAVASDRQTLVNLLFIELVEFKGQHAMQAFGEVFPAAAAQLSQRLQNTKGQLRPMPDPDRLMALIGVFFSQWFYTLVMGTGDNEAQRQARLSSAISIYLHGILADPPKEQ